jgi:predicted lipoprotein with Yx(FWY)xxD motif
VHTGACAVEWPPLRATGQPTVGGRANVSVVATSARSDGKRQVTYNGHPLYLFSADQKAGDTNGRGLNAFGGLWCVSSSGDEITTPAGSGGDFGY